MPAYTACIRLRVENGWVVLDELNEATGLNERLPFRVRIATADELEAVARLRALAYGRHVPALAAHLRQPEAADFEPGNEVFVAASKLDGSLLGTFRTHSNLFKPLPLEESMELPASFQGCRLIEATRLSVLGNLQASLVRNALFKAFFQYCRTQNSDWMLAAGRPPVDRLYASMLWRNVDSAGRLYPMAHAAGLPHRVMCMAPAQAESIWRAANHPLFRFAFQTVHADLDFSGVRALDAIMPTIDMSRGVANAIIKALAERPSAGAASHPAQCMVTPTQVSSDVAMGNGLAAG